MALKLKVTLVRSPIDRTQKQKDTVRGLGLRRLNQSSVLEDTPAVRGMIRKVQHLVTVEPADSTPGEPG
jgi:large subunit ribosomal protein L30